MTVIKAIEKYDLFYLLTEFVSKGNLKPNNFTLEFSNEAYFSSSVEAIEL
ncbi:MULTISPECIES: hypothetical protein [unclassified Pseudoalteromonas]|nr:MULTISPECIES: hypothetical protein [unclassified Pseudoalteromonas]